ncbi:MAG: hypothetical protein ACTSRK_02285 [Promethearchaeota archaeon]
MNQINIRVNQEINNLLEFLANRKKVSKAVYAKQLFIEQLTEKIIPVVLEEYRLGKIGIKKILKLTSLSADQLLDLIIEHNIEPPIDPELDDYTFGIAEKIIEAERKKQSS